MSGLFRRKKKKPLVVPPPPHGDLPTFPSPQELEEVLSSPNVPLEDHEVPKPPSEEFEVPEETTEPDQSSSAFIKIDTFQAVVDEVMDTRSRLEKSGKVVARLEEVHEEQTNLLKSWRHNIKGMHDKLLYVDEVLFKRG